MKKILIIAAVLVVVLIGSATAGWWWLTTTRSGAGWLLDRAAGFAPSLAWETLEGNLRDGLVLQGLRIEQAGASVAIDRLELSVHLDLPPGPRADVRWLRASGGEIHLPAAAETAATEDAPLVLPDLTLPVEIVIRELGVSDFLIHPGQSDAPIRIDRVDLAGRAEERLTLDKLAVELPGLSATMTGDWGLAQPFAGQMAINADYRLDDATSQGVQATITGDLSALEIDLDAEGPARLAGQVTLREPLESLDAELELGGRLGDWPGLDLAIEDLAIDGGGGLPDWQLNLAGQAVGPGIPDNEWTFELAGDPDQIEVRTGRVEMLSGLLGLTGTVNLAAGPRARLRLEAEALDLAALSEAWPATARLTGGLDLDASPDRISVDQLRLTALPAALSLEGSGRWSPADDELAADLRWRDLDWPLLAEGDQRQLQSRSGTLLVTGRLSDWRMELDGLLRLLDQPELEIEARARGNQERADIERLSADAGAAGRIHASGRLQLPPALDADLDLQIVGLDTGRFAAELPGRIDADLGLQATAPDAIVLDLRALDGELRNQPLSGRGRVSLRRDQPEAGQLNVELGDNRLELTSVDGSDWQLALDANALRQLLPELAGRLQLAGQVDLAAGTGTLAGTLHDAAWGRIQLQSADLESSLRWADDRPAAELALHLSALDLNPWERIEQLELTLDGHCDDHRARLNLVGQRGSIDMAAGGQFNSCELAELQTWSGRIDQLDLAETIAGDWALDEPLLLNVTGGNIEAEAGCLVETTDRTGRICLRALEVADGGRADIAIEQVPMDLLLVPFDPVFNLTTPLSGEVQAGWTASGGVDALAGELRLDSGVLQPLGTDTSLLAIDRVRLAFEPESELLKVSLEALLEGDSRLSGEARLLDLQDLSSATIDADARLSLPDIGVFNRLVTDLDQLGGRLNSEVRVRGALLGPSLDGHVELSEGLIVNAPLGLRIEDIRLRLDGTETSADVTGSLRSGEGRATLSGALDLVDDQWQVETSLSGENFVFANVDWLQLRASPEIRLQRSAEGLTTIDGDIRINHLRAGVPPGAAERINASDDIRIRGETEEAEEDSAMAAQLQGRLGLDLGDDARLAALGMEAWLAGGLELQWDRNRLEPQASGVIRIPEGSYQAYGQNLEIEDGEVIFTGHAVDNPSLDIAAVRDIFGDPQVEAAGVRIRGNAREPRINLFTDPPTSEEKALAYVVTGANFDHASGQAAVNIGFYLLPRLFVSYGIGLFEAGNVLSGRYELSRRWGVRVVSGERDTGVDLSYAIDR
ncbi:MAG: translocation/assembly module TamB domain-containing protein [Wenzhouxiangella sp.]